jgi:hypothetical protein
LTSSQSTEPAALQNFQGQYQQRSAHDNVIGVQLFGHLLLDIASLSDFVICAHLHFSFVGDLDVVHIVVGILNLQWQPGNFPTLT